MAVGEVFLAAFIAALFERLASRHLLNFAFQEGIHDRLNNWRKTLSKIQAVLTDAEEKQFTNIDVKIWLEELQDLADDLDDLLDYFIPEPQAETSMMLPKFISDLSNTVMIKYKMESKINDISARLDKIFKDKINLELKENFQGIKSEKQFKRPPSTSLKPRVYGREEDRKQIIELLLKDGTDGDDQFSVISILGMGGIGKTTLAQDVYNDKKVQTYFDLKAWACVSDDFDVVALTRKILLSLDSEARNLNDFDALQRQLHNQLAKGKFLLVLDDIWNENYGEWNVLSQPFLVGAPGSKILITTRNERVASIMMAVPAYRLNGLGVHDGLSLLAQHALNRRNFDENPHLKEIGKQIAVKCKGLPLAIRTLGGLLRSKLCPSEWEDILTSKIWDISEQESDILPALRLSFHHLPSHLKQCFVYCSIFPKDYEFEKDELVLLWMATGLLRQSEGRKRIEDIGRKYFDDLLSRSFFQQSSSDKSRFVMHDLMNDLAQLIAGQICFRLDDKSKGNKHDKISSRARHFAYFCQEFEVFQKFMDLYEVQRLRTFLPLSTRKFFAGAFHLSNKVLHDLLPKLQGLRVLSLCHYSLSELPDSIGDLKHLRYLDLSCTFIKWLPESVSTLYNLQTLSLGGCSQLCRLPKNIGNLINLRHLDNANTGLLQEMPSGIGKLTNLQTLSKFVVGRSSELRLKELGNLMFLRGTLSIKGLENVDTRDAMGANLRCMLDLDELELGWDDLPCVERLERDVHVLDMLEPCRNLKMFKIDCYGGMRFPSWIGDPSFCEVIKVSLNSCANCISLPPLGQLCKLKDLCISDMKEVRNVGAEFYGDGCPLEFQHFPSLQNLCFENMPEWEEWSHFSSGGDVGEQFPRLSKLTLRRCPKLIRLPLVRFSSLRSLALKECHGAVLKGFANLTSLITLELGRLKELTCLHEEFMQSSVALEVLNVYQCKELVSLWQNGITLENLVRLKVVDVWNCQQLVSVGEEGQGLPRNLEVLRLDRCDNLEKLPKGLNSLTSLRELHITDCPKLVSFPETAGPLMLRRLHIGRCKALEFLPKAGISHIEELSIGNCPSLRSTGKLATTLKKLIVYDCLGLESMPLIEGISRLEEMHIVKCPSLRSLPTAKLPTTLKKLYISSCTHLLLVMLQVQDNNNCSMSSSLETLSICDWVDFKLLVRSVHSFASLVVLHIYNCDDLECFPEGGLPTPNLRHLSISSCRNLRSLPDRIQSLASLEFLCIWECTNLESFPNAKLPPNLTLLHIIDCEKLKPLSEWGLHRLISLRRFVIQKGYPELVSFCDNDDDCLFPPTLTYLDIIGLPNLESLSMGLQNLTSLEKLVLINCPNLRSLPKIDLLPALSNLDIQECPVLKKGCLKDEGHYWPQIADIPLVMIDGDPIN